MAKRRRGKQFRPCWNCGIEINFTLTEVRDGKNIFHWRERNGEIHHCSGKYDQKINMQHIRSIAREK